MFNQTPPSVGFPFAHAKDSGKNLWENLWKKIYVPFICLIFFFCKFLKMLSSLTLYGPAQQVSTGSRISSMVKFPHFHISEIVMCFTVDVFC